MMQRFLSRGAPSAHHGNGTGHGTGQGAAMFEAAAVPRNAVAPVGDLPYLRGRREFESVFTDVAKAKRNWQLVAVGATAVALVLAVSLGVTATQSRIVPYVVEVDQLGRAQAFGAAERLRAPDQRVITSQLAGFVRDLRTVLVDPAGQADLVRRAYAFVDRDAAGFLNAYFTAPANDPRLLGRELSRLVEVTGVLPVPTGTPTTPAQGGSAGPATWKVSWTETTYPRAATGLARRTAWEGYFATRLVPPSTADRIVANPLGLYVTAINWTQIGDGVDVAAPSAAASLDRGAAADPRAEGAALSDPAAAAP